MCFVYYKTISLELSIVLRSIIKLSGFFIEHKYVAINKMQFINSITPMVISAIVLYLIIRHLMQNRLEKKILRLINLPLY